MAQALRIELGLSVSSYRLSRVLDVCGGVRIPCEVCVCYWTPVFDVHIHRRPEAVREPRLGGASSTNLEFHISVFQARPGPRNPLEYKRHPPPPHENRVSTLPESPQTLASLQRKQQKPLKSRNKCGRLPHCCTIMATQLQGISCDKRPDLHQKLAANALAACGAHSSS